MAAKRKKVTSEHKLGQMDYNSILRLQIYHDSIILKIIVLTGVRKGMQHSG